MLFSQHRRALPWRYVVRLSWGLYALALLAALAGLALDQWRIFGAGIVLLGLAFAIDLRRHAMTYRYRTNVLLEKFTSPLPPEEVAEPADTRPRVLPHPSRHVENNGGMDKRPHTSFGEA